jgi:uncharacterized RDD family membrane protein YckC
MVIDEIPFEKESPAKKNQSEILNRLANPIDRLAATVADVILFSPVLAVLIAPFRRQILESQLIANDEAFASGLLSAVLVGVLVFLIYHVAFLVLWGATPGKRIMGLKVEYIWHPEQRLAPMSAFVRSCAWLIEAACLGIPFAAVFGNEQRRPFHDRMAETVVVCLRRSRTMGAPNLTEMAMASGVTAAFLTAFAVVFCTSVLRSHQRPDSEVSADLEESGALCANAGEGYRSWIPAVGEAKPSRLAVAIAMFGAGSVDEDCLRTESKYAFWQSAKATANSASEQDAEAEAQAYLAQAVVETKSTDDFNSYLKKICEVDPEGDSCKVVALIQDPDEKELSSIEREESVGKVIDSVGGISQPFLKIWALRYLAKAGRSGRGLQLISMISPETAYGNFVAAERARALWLLNRESEATVAFNSVLDSANESERVALSRWFCEKEILNSNCSASSTRACAALNASVSHSSQWLQDARVATVYLQNASCTNSLSGKRLDEIAKTISDESSTNFFAAFSLLSRHHTSEALKAFSTIADLEDESENNQVFAHAARLMLVNLAPKVEDLESIKTQWMTSKDVDEPWTDLGKKLSDRYAALGDWGRSFEVGRKLIENSSFDPRFMQTLVVAAFRSGHRAVAESLLAKSNEYMQTVMIQSQTASPPEGSRAPASVDAYAEVVRELSQEYPK